jgi:hypothetical protein
MKRQIPKTNKTVTVSCVGEHPTSAKQVGVLHFPFVVMLEKNCGNKNRYSLLISYTDLLAANSNR